MMSQIRSYGVKDRIPEGDEVAQAVESLRMLGYAVLDGGYSAEELDELSTRFDNAQKRSHAEHGGSEQLARIDEHRTVRAMLSVDPAFLDLARNERLMRVCTTLIGDYFILNQQNGIINPPNGQSYNQASWHRDLPYQHFVSSRPLALNALFCLDQFTPDNGSTLVLPATHKQEPFPSDHAVHANAKMVTAPRGCFIVLDAMLYHSGGVNTTAVPRRAINHVYTIPLIRQQIDFPSILGDRYASDPVLAAFLGYGVRTPTSLADYYRDRLARLTPAKS
jgi:ectoine hydroxylase-related dioxygenase (phytanoyl-CoA dioxygenase family)